MTLQGGPNILRYATDQKHSDGFGGFLISSSSQMARHAFVRPFKNPAVDEEEKHRWRKARTCSFPKRTVRILPTPRNVICHPLPS
ncbi:hypothetical protein TNCV_3555811 [Trichonephila clavipes]|nr:hypothetical protein TNCV_3555811 [Trichonephila clavipes]